jgi:drug/metabolite transporter (DMT)-like permease
MVNGICMSIGGLLALLTAAPVEGFCPISSVIPFISYLALYILISNIISYNLYGFLLRSYTVTFMSLAGFMAPLFASLYGWIFLHEPLSQQFILSACMLAIGLYLFYQDEAANKPSIEDTHILP